MSEFDKQLKQAATIMKDADTDQKRLIKAAGAAVFRLAQSGMSVEEIIKILDHIEMGNNE